MKDKREYIIKDQELFFNQNSLREKINNQNPVFYNYANKEQFKGLDWLAEKMTILDYGCGTGTTIDIFLRDKKPENYHIYGVDIAQLAVDKAREKYPNFQFYKISDNKIPQIEDNSLEAAYLLHVLHHSRNHADIFKEISSKLKPAGKFFLSDLSSNNLIIKAGRFIFLHLPLGVKNKFRADDLVVDGKIPEKYKVDIKTVINQLKMSGFIIEEMGYGHLFFFIFVWLDRFIPFFKLKPVKSLYAHLMKLEKWLLQYNFFQKQAEVFYVKCVKR